MAAMPVWNAMLILGMGNTNFGSEILCTNVSRHSGALCGRYFIDLGQKSGRRPCRFFVVDTTLPRRIRPHKCAQFRRSSVTRHNWALMVGR